MPFKIDLERNGHGHNYGEFSDMLGTWHLIGEGDVALVLGRHPAPMVLSREMAAALIPLLQRFVDTGTLK